jgi:hypothetical protein
MKIVDKDVCIYFDFVMFPLNGNKCRLLLPLHILRIQIPGRAGVTAEAFVHVFAVNFEGKEQVFISGGRINAELGEVAEETFAGGTSSMREGVFRLGEECLQFVAGEFGHAGCPL